MMQQYKKIIFIILAFLIVSCLILAGISIAERSLLGLILSLLSVVILMGIGFTFKKKMEKRSE